jgi:hypothetical protein
LEVIRPYPLADGRFKGPKWKVCHSDKSERVRKPNINARGGILLPLKRLRMALSKLELFGTRLRTRRAERRILQLCRSGDASSKAREKNPRIVTKRAIPRLVPAYPLRREK